jgi:hypothetical protein
LKRGRDIEPCVVLEVVQKVCAPIAGLMHFLPLAALAA